MITLLRLFRVGVALALIVAVPGSTRAQPSFPMSCDQARHYLIVEGASRTNIVLASRRIVTCGDMAPTTLMATIRSASPGTVRDTVAKEAAWLLSDRRLLDSVIALSRDLRVGVARRTVALELLTHYADGKASLLPGLQHDPMPLVIAHRMHGDYFSGNAPMDAKDQDRALAAIRQVGLDEPDDDLRLLAKLAAEQLGLRRRHHLPPP